MVQSLEAIFLTVLNMSITAGYVILFVLLARLPLRKAPKVFSYGLWLVALFRLACPFSFASAWSFLTVLKADSTAYIPANIGLAAQPEVNVGINGVNQAINGALPAANAAASANPLQFVLFAGSLLWVLGVLIMLTYGAASYVLLKRRVGLALRLEGSIGDNIFEEEGIQSPFVLGILKPKIYLPLGLSDSEKSYMLKHEQIHIQRLDYLVKPLAFLLLCIHWFNPLVWLSFFLLHKDMEMSCDERVLREMGPEIKQDYSSSLLSLAAGGKMIGGSPLAFGESNVKSRIKNVLKYKRPALGVLALTAVLIIAVSFSLLANPLQNKLDFGYLEGVASTAEGFQPESLWSYAEVMDIELLQGAGLPQLAELGLGQSIGQSVAWENSVSLTVDYVMADENQLLLFYTIKDPAGGLDEGDSFRLSLKGLWREYLPQNSRGLMNEEKTEMINIVSFEPPVFLERVLTLEIFRLRRDGGVTTPSEIRFRLDKDRDMGHVFKKTLRAKVEVDQMQINIDSILATPTKTVVKGSGQNIFQLVQGELSGERPRLYDISLKLFADGREIPRQGAGIGTGMTGITFSSDFAPLPSGLKQLQLELASLTTEQTVNQRFPLSRLNDGDRQKPDSQQRLDILGQLVEINGVETLADETRVTISSAEGLILSKVSLIVDGREVPLEQTIMDQYDKGEDGSLTHTRTLRFLTVGDKLELNVQRMVYRENYSQIINIPLN